MQGFSSLAGLLAWASCTGERLPTSSSLAVALQLFDVDPYSAVPPRIYTGFPFSTLRRARTRARNTKRDVLPFYDRRRRRSKLQARVRPVDSAVVRHVSNSQRSLMQQIPLGGASLRGLSS